MAILGRLVLWMLPFVCILLVSRPLEAQVVEPRCSYEECALRVEPGLWGLKIVRGVDAEPVARLMLFGSKPGLTQILSGDQALTYAHRYQRRSTLATALFFASAASFLASGLTEESWSKDAQTALVVGGGVLGVSAIVSMTDAHRALSRALWWHNAHFSR